MFGFGISKVGDILDLGATQGILKKSGAFYSYGDTRLGQGRENSKEFLTQHPEIADSIEARIRAFEQDKQKAANEARETRAAALSNGAKPAPVSPEGLAADTEEPEDSEDKD